MTLIASLEGRLLAIECTRQVRIHENLIKLSRVTFLVSFGVHLKMGTMMLWQEELNNLSNLHLGQNYSFIAGLEMEGDLFVLYFLPQLTKFENS
jgi:hypothetical protein